MDSNDRHPGSEPGVAAAELPRNGSSGNRTHLVAVHIGFTDQLVSQDASDPKVSYGFNFSFRASNSFQISIFGFRIFPAGCSSGLEPPSFQGHGLAPRPLRDRTPSSEPVRKSVQAPRVCGASPLFRTGPVPWMGFEPTISWLRTKRPLQAGTARAFLEL